MKRALIIAAGAVALGLASASSMGMTAIKSGATGSAFTNAKSSIDAYNKDPSSSSKATQAAIDPLGISDFQITIQYPAEAVRVAAPDDSVFPPVMGLNGYFSGGRTGQSPIVSNVIQGSIGLVTVRGYFENPNAAPQYDLNTVAVTFVYNGISSTGNAPPINLRVVPQPGDFFRGIDQDTGDTITFDYLHIDPSETGLFDYETSAPSMTLVPHGGPAVVPDLVVPGDGSIATLDYVYSGRGTRTLGFATANPGTVQIAIDFSEDRAGDIASLISQLGLLPVDPAFGPGYDAMFVTTGLGLLEDFNFDLIFTSGRITDFAVRAGPTVIPEPVSIVGLVAALPLVARRRR